MKLRHIEVFRAVFIAGSVAGAAKVLHVSAPGVSKMISYLEAKLRCALFIRSKGKLVPTVEATQLFLASRTLFLEVNKVQALSAQLGVTAHEQIVVATSPSPGLRIVPESIRFFSEQYPLTRVALEVLPFGEMIDDLLAGSIDVAFSLIAPVHPEIAARSYFDVGVVCVFPQDHELASLPNIQLQDLARFSLIRFHADTLHGTLIESMLTDAGIKTLGNLKVRYSATALALVRAGNGVALVDEVTARDAGIEGLLYRGIAMPTLFRLYALSAARNPKINLIAGFQQAAYLASQKLGYKVTELH